MTTWREVHEAIGRGDEAEVKQALLRLASVLQVVSTAALELNGHEKLKTGKDILMDRSRLILSDFIGLNEKV